MAEWKLINAENVKPFCLGEVYSSKLLTGDEMAGRQVININEGTLAAGARTSGAAHEKTEIYYIVKGSGDVWLDNDCVHVKPGDIIIIPPDVFHWIDNRMNDEPFVLFTLWPRQEDNGVYQVRLKAWGKSMKTIDEE
ncbi:MAG: cupin domain-containing protein [Eubacteriales bacterium]|nr:cupin domain-containing protein [Eubacteriales bacterium]